MKKKYITFILLFFMCHVLMAQYSGGNGKGDATADLYGKHLTNWFYINGSMGNPVNWLDGIVPSLPEEANIKAAATLDGSYTYAVVNISSSASITIIAGTDLTVTNALLNTNGVNGILIQDGGSLIQSTPDVPATVERLLSNADWTNGMDGWHLLSSPVENQLVANGGFTSDPYDFYAWSETVNDWLNQKDGANNITSFVPGNAYLVSYDDGGIKSFAGELNVNGITFSDLSLTSSSYYAGYHLLGNPFSSALKWDDGNWALSNVGGVASVWNEIAQNYLSLSNPNDIIPVNQGFFVQVIDASNSITIPAQAKTHSTQSFYKETPSNFLKLRISNSINETYDETIVRMKDDATSAYDLAYDSHKISGSDIAPQLYTSIQEGERVAVNTLATTNFPVIVDMGFHPGLTAKYKLTAETFAFNRQVILEDKATGITKVMGAGESYTFHGAIGDAENRFVLHFSPLVTPGPGENDLVEAYFSDGRLYIHSTSSEKGNFRVYDLTGKPVTVGAISAESLESVDVHGFAAGIYLVNIITGNTAIRQKVFIP